MSSSPLPIPASTQVGLDPLAGLKSIFDPATLTRKGLCPVSDLRSPENPIDSHDLYFELHGSGPEKVLFIMGLNSTSFAWSSQVAHFGPSPNHSVLVYDNRGVGNSSAPRGPFTTSAMAEDAITLLDYIGWTEKHSVHVVGVSLGGMISQELAYRIPERLASLSLIVTTPGGRPWSNLPPWKGFYTLTRATTLREPRDRISLLVDCLFPKHWLDAPSERVEGKSNREVQEEAYNHRIAYTRPQPLPSSLAQMSAGLTHHVTPSRLLHIAKRVPRVLILTGDDDNLVDPEGSRRIATGMGVLPLGNGREGSEGGVRERGISPDGRVEYIMWQGSGHGINAQDPKRFNAAIEKVWTEGRRLVAEGWQAESSD